jgi:hypothetical protein
MGARRSRGRGTERVSVGRQFAGIAAELFRAMEKRSRAGGRGGAKRVRALRHGRKRPRMVRGLAQRGLLRHVAGSQSTGAYGGDAPRVARRLVAALHESFALRGKIKHPARISIRRLRISRGERFAIGERRRCGVRQRKVIGGALDICCAAPTLENPQGWGTRKDSTVGDGFRGLRRGRARRRLPGGLRAIRRRGRGCPASSRGTAAGRSRGRISARRGHPAFRPARRKHR